MGERSQGVDVFAMHGSVYAELAVRKRVGSNRRWGGSCASLIGAHGPCVWVRSRGLGRANCLCCFHYTSALLVQRVIVSSLIARDWTRCAQPLRTIAPSSFLTLPCPLPAFSLLLFRHSTTLRTPVALSPPPFPSLSTLAHHHSATVDSLLPTSRVRFAAKRAPSTCLRPSSEVKVSGT